MAGETAKNLVADIQAAGGIITLEDMANYQVGKVLKCVDTFINDICALFFISQ